MLISAQEWFLNVKELTVPKVVKSLVDLWEEMFPTLAGEEIRAQLEHLTAAASEAQATKEVLCFSTSICSAHDCSFFLCFSEKGLLAC